MDRIVIIEDDDSVRENIIKILDTSGYSASGAGNGKDGLELIMETEPSLIICDIMLPDINGYEILEFLNNSKRFKTVPFIFLTAKVEMSDLRKGMNLGADDYLTKPFHVSELLEVVKLRLNKSKLKVSEISNLEYNYNNKLSINQKLFLPGNNSAEFITVNEIAFIVADQSSTYVHINDQKKILVKKLLKTWEKILPEGIFLRINKSTIINTNAVKKIEKWFNNSYRVFLLGSNEPFVISSHYADKIKINFNT